MRATLPRPTFVRCPLDGSRVDVKFPCGHTVHTDLSLGNASAGIPEHECESAGPSDG